MMLETRAATLGTITERVIEIRVAPYGDTAELPGGLRERYLPGAFGIPSKPIPLKLETANGHSGPVVGVSIGWEDRSDGLFGTFKIAETPAGDEALTLAAMGALGASAGFLLDPANITRSRADDALEISHGDLREVTLTGTPAYAMAGPVEVRSMEGSNMENTPTPTTAEVPSVDIDGIVAAAVERAVDETRSAILATNAEQIPAVESAEHRGHEYRSIGEVVADMNLHARNRDSGASERLTRSIDSGAVASDGSRFEIREFAKNPPPVPNSVGSGVAYPAYVSDLLLLLREGRPVADLFNSRPLPATGNDVFFPEVSVGNTVDYQDGQGTVVDRTDQAQILTDWPKSTIAGGQPLSIQSQRWTDPSYFDSVVGDLAAAYAEFLDAGTINGDPAVDTPATGTGLLGILNAGATDVPVGGSMLAAIALFGTAWAAVYAGSRRAPIAAMMNGDEWGAALDLVDTDGRPIVTTDAPSNPAGIGNAASIAGSLRGVPVVVDQNVPAGNIIVGSFRDAVLMEDATPATLTLTFPDTLSTDVSIFGFSALAIRRPGSFAVLSGITP